MEERILDYLQQVPIGVALALVALAAMLEYVFPPFPGDAATLAAAFLVGAVGWDPAPVFLAINAGAMAGIYADYRFGGFVLHHDVRWRERFATWRRVGRSVDRILPLFERRPTFYLVVNRFLPSVRALFFVAAGMAGVPTWRVLLFGGVSSVCWCLLIFAVGTWIGEDWERLVSVFSKYQYAAWIVVGIVIAILIARLRGNRLAGS